MAVEARIALLYGGDVARWLKENFSSLTALLTVAP